jgi:hypothetical protein
MTEVSGKRELPEKIAARIRSLVEFHLKDCAAPDLTEACKLSQILAALTLHEGEIATVGTVEKALRVLPTGA